MALQTRVCEPVLAKMCAALKHRGPDGQGVESWQDHGIGLGHTRLAIIDPSPAGRQPLANEDQTVWITANAEIYNFRELRRELEQCGHRFRSQTDTEVILHAYEEWGDDHVRRLRGMFAYALYDRRSRKNFSLLLVRDRPGIKPLYYYRKEGLFLFASEIKALLEYPGLDLTPDRSALFDFPTYGYIPTPKTPYLHIRKLAPAHTLRYEQNRIEIRPYWDPVPAERARVPNVSEAAEKLEPLLKSAVSLSLVSDVPVGILLSGGMDSSAIAVLASEASPEPLDSFTADFDAGGFGETGFARMIAGRCQTRHRENKILAGAVRETLPEILRLYDEPFADSSAIPTYAVCQNASRHVKAVLSGEGGDEIFAGYARYADWLPGARFNRRPWQLREKIRAMLNRPGFDPSFKCFASRVQLLSPSQKRALFEPDWVREFSDYDDFWHLRRYWRTDLDPLTRVQYADFKTYLCDDLLTKLDRAAMAVSLEARPALLDHPLVEFLFSIPGNMRAHRGEKKYLLKHALKDLLPAPILNRPKKGFSVPWQHWMTAESEWFKGMLNEGSGAGILLPGLATRTDLMQRGLFAWTVLVLKEWSNQRRAYAVTE